MRFGDPSERVWFHDELGRIARELRAGVAEWEPERAALCRRCLARLEEGREDVGFEYRDESGRRGERPQGRVRSAAASARSGRRRLSTLITCVGSIGAQRPEVIGPASVPRLSLSDFRGRLPSGTLLVVDVRDELVYRAGHIPGAISVPLAEIEKYAPDLRGRAQQRLVVTYCSCPSEQTALTAAAQQTAGNVNGRVLWKRGLTNVSVLVGGYPEWVANGGAIEKGGGG